MGSPEYRIENTQQVTEDFSRALNLPRNGSTPEQVLPSGNGGFKHIKIENGALVVRQIDQSEAFVIQEKLKSYRPIRIEPEPMDTGTVLPERQKKVFDDRYAMKDEQGNQVEFYPEQMFRRVARAIADVEETEEKKQYWEQQFYGILEDFKFLPGGRILSGAGTGYEVTYYNCYVVPSPKDSRGGIMDNVKQTVEIQSRGGGVGVNLSTLRPEGERVRKVNGTSSGPMNWAELYSLATHDIIQQGGSRRGALMLMINDWHPDVWSPDPEKQKNKFITVKNTPGRIVGANLSVCVSDEFMEAVKNDGEWTTKFPDTTDPDYDELWDGDIKKWEAMGKPVKTYETFRARDMLRSMAQSYWNRAEPGVVFIDRYNKWSNTWYFEQIVSTNPCGEQGLPPGGVCNLAAWNLAAYVHGEIGYGDFDYESFARDAPVGMRFLDNVVDANMYFNDENIKAQKNVRRTGLGTTGEAHAAIKMGIRYGSPEYLEFLGKVHQILRDASYETSSDLAAEKGAFPAFDREKYMQGVFIQMLPDHVKEKIEKQGIRNGVILTQAPTGTTSELAGVSSGIEPVFSLEWHRQDRIGLRTIRDPLYEEWLEKHPNEELPDFFVTAHELTPEEHLRVQAVVQEYTDSSISKTINAPEEITVDEIEGLVESAYDSGCKGFAFYRENSRDWVLKPVDGHKEGDVGEVELKVRPTKDELPEVRRRIKTPVGTAFIHVSRDPEEDNAIAECFVDIGKGGADILADGQAMGRLISLVYRITPPKLYKQVTEEIIGQLKDIQGSDVIFYKGQKIKSLPDAISKILAKEIGVTLNGENGNGQENPKKEVGLELVKAEEVEFSGNLSSCCGAKKIRVEGCEKCINCGDGNC